MSAINCNDFSNQLPEWIEGERSAEARAHLWSCSHCRALVSDLEAIHQMAPSISLDDSEPSPRVWQAVRAQLEREGLIRARRHGWVDSATGWLDEVFGMIPRPAFAVGYLALLIAAGAALTGTGSRHANDARWLNRTENYTQSFSVQLDAAEQNASSVLDGVDPVVSASLHKNLAIVDNYIALCEKSVREDPQNEIARDYLYDAYQQKADLLAQMSDRGVDGQ